MKISSEQQVLLNALNAQHKEEINARAEMRAAIEAEYQTKLRDYRLRKAVLMIEGMDAGIPKSALGRAIGTTDWKTIQDMLTEGRKLRPEVVVAVARYTGYIALQLGQHDLYVAVVDAENPHEFTLGDLGTFDGWKVVLNTAVSPAAVMTATSEVEPDSEIARWAVDNWKQLQKKG